MLSSPTHLSSFRHFVVVLLTVGMAACSPPPVAEIPVATQTLIPSTSTWTPVPTATTTSTPPAVPGPLDILGTATSVPLTPLLAGDTPVDERVARELIDDLAQYLKVPTELVRFISVEAWIWTDESLGCRFPPRLEQSIPGLRYKFVVGNMIYEYHTVSGDARRIRCNNAQPLQDELLVRIDPVAAELFEIARQRLSRERDLPVRAVDLLSAASFTWPDTSLGCPIEGQTYDRIRIDGYRLILGVGDERFLFHTDSDSLYPCDFEREVLPPPLDSRG